MFPRFEIFDTGIIVYVFWLTLAVCFFLFTWMLKKLSWKVWVNASFFFTRTLWYFLSIVVFSRILYVISDWDDMRHIKNPLEFFVMSEYNFSLYGALIWFFFVLLYSLKSYKLKLDKYIDISVLSFLFMISVWFVGAFLGWQIYGKPTDLWIEVLYNHPFTIVPSEVPLFPLALVYAIWAFILFSISYSVFLFVNTRWIIGYIAFIAFNAMMLVGEVFTWKYDILKTTYLDININQILAVFFIIVSLYKLIQLIQRQPTKTEVISS